MTELIFLDTEGTGNEVSKDRLCQVSYQTSKGIKTAYFKPPVPVSVKAMSITHITNKMLEDKPAFEGSKFREELKELLADGVMVAHNALFYIAMLKAEGLEVPRFIDTLRVARYLDEENKIPEYGLQYLRYFLDLEIDGAAHEAENDVKVLEAIFKRLYAKLPDIDEMVTISSRPTLFKNFIFGKYKGKPVAEVLQTDRRYMEWLLNKMLSSGQDTDEDWIYTLKYYLGVNSKE